MPYAELHCTSNFSFLRGASHPEELVETAARLGHHALAITDLNSLAGVVRGHVKAKELGLKLVIGARITPIDGPELLMYPTDRAAYGRLSRLITRGRRRAEKGYCELTVADIVEHGNGQIIVIVPPRQSAPTSAPMPPRFSAPAGATANSRGRQPPVGDAKLSKPRRGERSGCATTWESSAERCASAAPAGLSIRSAANRGLAPPATDLRPYGADLLVDLCDAFARRCYLVASCDYGPHDRARLAVTAELARSLGIPLVAANDVHYHVPERRILQDVLVCIREGCAIHEAGYRLFPNAERHLKSPDAMARLFADHLDAIARTVEIADRCTFSLDELRYEYPDEIAPPGMTPIEYLHRLTWQGAAQRFPAGVPDKVRRQIEHELKLVEELRYEAYFLTVYDIVVFARSRGILCQGRGSAANSAVCYCIGITSVDPARIDVLFERFVSKERNEPPDIDVDFEHERREEVIQYIYAKYGRERAGLTAEVISYRPRSAIRDVGKALGLSLDAVDRLAKTCDWWDKAVPAERLGESGLDPRDRTVRLAIELSREIAGFPRHLSQHVGGFVMTRGRLDETVPIENAAMPDRTVIEWNKDDIDELGILKVDVLGLGMLTCIRKTFDLIEAYQPERLQDNSSSAHSRAAESRRLTLANVPPEDPLVYDMICNADTIGVFQIESRAQMSMLPRLRPRCFYDLVIEVAIVRPGPIQGKMVHPYLRRRTGEEAVSYPNPAVREVLEKTLGVPLFQEQVMKLAIVAAGFTPGEADQLRRAMAAWRRQGIIDRFERKFIEGMLSNGYDRGFAERLFDQVRGFGEYGFPESHAASFALLVYVSAWLKRYHPAAFAAALINSQPMGFYAAAQIIRDAREHGVEVCAVDVNYSGWDCALENAECGMRNAEFPQRRTDADAASSTGHRPHPPARRDIPHSAWSSPAVAGIPHSLPLWGAGGPTIRLGFRLVRGLSQPQFDRLVAARGEGLFASVADLARRAGLGRGALMHLARADAMRSLGLDRRAAMWQVLALEREFTHQPRATTEDAPHSMGLRVQGPGFRVQGSETEENAEYLGTPPPRINSPLLNRLEPAEPHVQLPPMPLPDHVAHDYLMTGLSLKAHPVSLVRDRLNQHGTLTTAQITASLVGRWVSIAGLVTCRQRPDTASGVVFVTLEDETGVANLIVKSPVYERFRAAIRHATLLWVRGRVEGRDRVINVLIHEARDLSAWLPGVPVTSHDFH